MKINKKDLTVNIHKRLGGVVSKNQIYDVITIICDYISEELLENRSVTIKSFGTLSPYVFHGHEGMDISRGEMRYVEEFRSVKFRPHHILLRLVQRKRKKFTRKP